MLRYENRWVIRIMSLLACLAFLGLAGLLFYRADRSRAQQVSIPIPRRMVISSAYDYRLLPWFADADSVADHTYTYEVGCTPSWTESRLYTSEFDVGFEQAVAYKWGGGDFINRDLTPTPGSGNENFPLRIEHTDDLAKGQARQVWPDDADFVVVPQEGGE